MPIIKDKKLARKKIEEISNRFDITQRKKELKVVEEIIENVKCNGDEALFHYSKSFDKVNLDSIKLSSEKINKSINEIPKDLKIAIKKSIQRIKRFQKNNIPKSWIKSFNPDEKMGYRYSPLDSVGIYIPGGKIPLISTVLMTVIPAQVAGVKRIALFTPPPVSHGILAACKILGINEIYQIGGSQAIAAAAFGTQSVKSVCKVVGPGNIYVTLAKKMLFGKIGIDGLYGPSEIAIIADNNANPEFIAYDLLSQLEHGSGLESAVLVTSSEVIAKSVEKFVLEYARKLPNKETVLKSWKNNSVIIVVKNINEAVDLINYLAPEHLEIITSNSETVSRKINNAGAIFVGEYTCESVGDYIAGPSHCLPTGGSARFSSGLTVMDFMKKISYVSFNKKSLKRNVKEIIQIANAEKLPAHAGAVKIRLGIK